MSDEINNLLNRIQREKDQLKNLSGEHQVSVSEVLSDNFMSQHTKFKNLDEFWKLAGLVGVSLEDAPQQQLDEFTAANSKFKDVQEMINKAIRSRTQSQVNDILNE